MKLRKLAAVAALAGALVVGGASTAAAYPLVPGPGASVEEVHQSVSQIRSAADVLGRTVAVSNGSHADWNITPAVRAALDTAVAAGGSAHHIDVTYPLQGVYWNNGGVWTRLTQDVDYTVHPGSTIIVLTDAFRSRQTGDVEVRAVFRPGAEDFHVTLTTAGTRPDTSVNDVRPVHPATGPAALLYGVGGLLLAGGGATVVASSRRRKAENV